MYRIGFAILLAVLLATVLGMASLVFPVRGQSITPAAALERLMRAEPIREEWFAPSFLAVVPPTWA